MIEATDSIVTMKDAIRAVGEVAGIFIMGLGVGIIGVLRKRTMSLKPSQWTSIKEKKFVEQHGQVHELLTEMRVTLRASRCLIFQFHNGGNFSDGSSIKRFSVTHESCASGITSMLLESQDVLLTRYIEAIRILEESPNKILSVNSLPLSCFRSGLEINNVVFFTISTLKCLDGLTPLGFVCCHWCDLNELDGIHEEGIEESSIEQLITQTTHQINNYLSIKKTEK